MSVDFAGVENCGEDERERERVRMAGGASSVCEVAEKDDRDEDEEEILWRRGVCTGFCARGGAEKVCV